MEASENSLGDLTVDQISLKLGFIEHLAHKEFITMGSSVQSLFSKL